MNARRVPRRSVREAAMVNAPACAAAKCFRGDPAAWLPEPVLMHGKHEFQATLRLAGARLVPRLLVGGGIIDGEVVARRLSVDLAGTSLAWLVGSVDGYLNLAPGAGGQQLVLVATWRPAGITGRGGPGSLAVRALMRGFVRRVAARLAAGTGRLSSGNGSADRS